MGLVTSLYVYVAEGSIWGAVAEILDYGSSDGRGYWASFAVCVSVTVWHGVCIDRLINTDNVMR